MLLLDELVQESSGGEIAQGVALVLYMHACVTPGRSFVSPYVALMVLESSSGYQVSH